MIGCGDEEAQQARDGEDGLGWVLYLAPHLGCIRGDGDSGIEWRARARREPCQASQGPRTDFGFALITWRGLGLCMMVLGGWNTDTPETGAESRVTRGERVSGGGSTGKTLHDLLRCGRPRHTRSQLSRPLPSPPALHPRCQWLSPTVSSIHTDSFLGENPEISSNSAAVRRQIIAARRTLGIYLPPAFGAPLDPGVPGTHASELPSTCGLPERIAIKPPPKQQGSEGARIVERSDRVRAGHARTSSCVPSSRAIKQRSHPPPTSATTMSPWLITFVAFVPVLLLALSFLRSTVLSKYLDDKSTRRRQPG